MSLKYTLKQRVAAFYEKIDMRGPICKHLGTRCHIWTSQLDGSGYGVFFNGDSRVQSHRYIWELKYGQIPVGVKLLHKCDIRPCCNDEHLYLGTQIDNMRDMMIRRRRFYTITPEQALAIKKEYAAGGISMQKLAEKYGLKAAQSVFKIVHGTDWMYA